MGDRPGRLFPRRIFLGLFSARAGKEPRVPLGGGRPAGDHRPGRTPLLLPGALERTGPDPQGASLRPDRSRRESRGGRQGGLLLPRLDPHPLLYEGPLQTSPGGISIRPPGRGEPQAVEDRAGIRVVRHRRLRRREVFRRDRGIRQSFPERHPDPGDRGQPRPRGVRPRCPADPLVPEHLVLGAHGGRVLAETADPSSRRRVAPCGAGLPRPVPFFRRLRARGEAARVPVHGERNERGETVRHDQRRRAMQRTHFTRSSSTAEAMRSTRRKRARRRARDTAWRSRREPGSPSVSASPRRTRHRGNRLETGSKRFSRIGSGRRTTTIPPSSRDTCPRKSAALRDRGTPGSSGRNSFTTSPSRIGSRGTLPIRRRPRAAGAAGTATGPISTTGTSSPCPTSGSTPGTRRGTWRST